MKHLWIVITVSLFVLMGLETVGWAKPAHRTAKPSASVSKKATQTKAKAKRNVAQGKDGGDLGPPPPPASNEIPPPPPPLKKRKKRRSRYGRSRKSKRERYEDLRRWEQRYGNGRYYRRKRRRRVRRKRRRRARRSWYRRYRRNLRRRRRNRARFWWSSETGLYLFSYTPNGNSSVSYEYMGMIAGGRIGVAYRSLVVSFGAAMAFSLFDDANNDDFANVGGIMGRLTASLGWSVGKYILLEGGLNMEYLQLNRGSQETSSLLFPAFLSATLRFPMGRHRRSSVGIQALFSVAYDPNSDGTYFSTTLGLVFQTF